jgi:transcriptional regulator with XRE-family HTH domain
VVLLQVKREMDQRADRCVISPVATMTACERPIHYVAGNGSAEFRVIGFGTSAHPAAVRAERPEPVHIGEHLRQWRLRRHLSQLDLAGDAEVSTRHLSFVETGRAAPSRDMVLKLAERLNVPLRERNVLLVAAGFAPAFPQRAFDDPALKSARAAIDLVLRAHEPSPALAYDRYWNLVSANRMVMPLLAGVPQRLLTPPVNILRLAFHPEALAARTVNVAEWCGHLLERLRRQCEAIADPGLIQLHDELKGYPLPARSAPLPPDSVAIPFKLRFGGDILSFMSATMIFGTPVDVTLSELALETFFPADEFTAGRMRKLAADLP